MAMIQSLEMLQNIQALGLGVFFADPTREEAYYWPDFQLKQGYKGVWIQGTSADIIYVHWLGMEDSSYKLSFDYQEELRLFEYQQEAQNHISQVLAKRLRK